MLEQITPLILTLNEAPNIARTLRQLSWAREVVVVDSYSEDETLEIVASFSNVRVVQREFDSHAAQWNFALKETGIKSAWVLAMDADYVLTPDLVDELRSLRPDARTNGYQASFTYCINGRPLRSGVYTPVTVLYRRALAAYRQDGHTHRLVLNDQAEGQVQKLRSRILHDDRKSLRRWFESQERYMSLEVDKLLAADFHARGRMDQIRRLRMIAPLAVLFYCLILRGGILDGRAGFYYAFQRMLAELLLSLYLIEHDLNSIGRRKPAAAAERPVDSRQSIR